MFPILQLGPLAIQVPGLVLITGLWLGLALAEREAKRLNLNPDQIYNLAYILLITAVVAGRLVYVLRSLNAYLVDPWGLVSLNPATLAVPEGVGVGLVAAWVYHARAKLSLRSTLDAFAPTLAVLAIALALAHIASGDAFGAPTQLPWRIYLWDEYRHPAQFYELALAGIVFGVWWRVRGLAPVAGFNFLLVVALGSASVIFLEAFRGDSEITLAGLRVMQLWGLAGLAGSLIGLRYWVSLAATHP
jgi:prolipoprotein diacylglyceryltransferase